MTNRWVTYGIFEKDGSFYYHDELTNDITVSEHDCEDLPAIGGADMEGHLLGVFYKDDTVTITAFHGLTDGGGLTMFIDSLLEAYAAYKNGETHTPEAVTYEDGNAEPFEIAGRLFDKVALPDTFCICMNQGSDSTDYADALCAVFKENGITSRIESVNRCR